MNTWVQLFFEKLPDGTEIAAAELKGALMAYHFVVQANFEQSSETWSGTQDELAETFARLTNGESNALYKKTWVMSRGTPPLLYDWQKRNEAIRQGMLAVLERMSELGVELTDGKWRKTNVA